MGGMYWYNDRLSTPHSYFSPKLHQKQSAHNWPCCLSQEKVHKEATVLMLKLWKSKTSKSYNVLFTRWSTSCFTRGPDLFSGPVIEVINFLANLH